MYKEVKQYKDNLKVLLLVNKHQNNQAWIWVV